MTVLVKLAAQSLCNLVGAPNIQIVILIELFGYGASFLIFCDESHRMSGEMVGNYQHRDYCRSTV